MLIRVGVGDPTRRTVVGPFIATLAALALILSVGATSAAAATGCRAKIRDTGQTFPRLQAAVAAAVPGSRIIFRGTCRGTVVIDKDLTIRGLADHERDKPILSAGGKGRVITVAEGVSVALQNLVVRDGEAADGAGIRNHGDLTLTDVIVRNNSTPMNGEVGGVYNTGSLTLEGSSLITFNWCFSVDCAGGVWNGGALTLNDASAIEENVGAGIIVDRSGRVSLNGSSTVSDNMSDGGGGIRTAGVVTMNDSSSIHENDADAGAGAYVDTDGTLTLNDDSSIHGNYIGLEDGRGSGVLVAGGRLTLNDGSSIHDNRAQGPGGGVAVEQGGFVVLDDRASITGNDAPDGAGVYLADGSLTMAGSADIRDNEAWWDGGGLYDAGGVVMGVRCGSAAQADVHDNTPDDCYCDVTGRSQGGPSTQAPVTGPVVGRFTSTGSLAQPRWWHTASAMPDGRVLVVGGVLEPDQAGDDDAPGALSSSAEVWDPMTGEFTPAGSLVGPRAAHSSTSLSDGRILIVGGYGGADGDELLRRVEVWDPETQESQRVGRLTTGRAGHTATLLPDGRVFIIGGADAKAKAEIWDPASGRSTSTGRPVDPRLLHTATPLPDGRVVIIGGQHARDARALDSIEVWDPETGKFTLGGTLPEPRMYHTATALDDGRIAVLGGITESGIQTEVLVWDPETGASIAAGSLRVEHANHTATLLSDGRVLVIGGGIPTMGAYMTGDLHLSGSGEIWDPTTGQTLPAGTLPESLVYHTATLLVDGRVLVAGGMGDAGAPTEAQVLELAEAPLPSAEPSPSPSHEPVGEPSSAGGREWTCRPALGVQATPSAEPENEADPAPSGHFAPAGSLAAARAEHTATVLPDGRVLVVGGGACCPLRSLTSAEVWDPVTGAFGPTGPLAEVREDHQAVVLPDGRVLAIGGWGDGTSVATAEAWNPATDTFSAAGSLAEPLDESATVLDDGRVLVIGGWGPRGALGGAAVWDPATETFGPAGELGQPRGGHTATRLPDGRVLIIGGGTSASEDFLASAEVWDPETMSFGPAGTLIEARWNHTAELLPDGRVLVVGGEAHEGDYVEWVEIWDPATATFRRAGSLIEPRIYHTTTLLPGGRVLAVGGYGAGDAVTLASAEVWDTATERFEPAGPLAEARRNHTATLLPDGRVLVVGGRDFSELVSAEVWAPGEGSADTEAGSRAPVASLAQRVSVVGADLSFGPPDDWVVSSEGAPRPSSLDNPRAWLFAMSAAGGVWTGDSCGVSSYASTTGSLDGFVADYLEAFHGVPNDVLVSDVMLPAGPAARLVGGSAFGQTAYVLRDGRTVHVLECGSERQAPEDGWLSIAESLRFDGVQAGDTVPDGRPRLHVEVPDAGFAITLPEAWEVSIPRSDPTVTGGRRVLVAQWADTGACSVLWWEDARDGDTEWDDLEGFADMYASTSPPLSEGRTRTEVELPAGAATRIDDRGSELDSDRVDYLLSDGASYYALSCEVDPAATYDPLKVAETFEFLAGA